MVIGNWESKDFTDGEGSKQLGTPVNDAPIFRGPEVDSNVSESCEVNIGRVVGKLRKFGEGKANVRATNGIGIH